MPARFIRMLGLKLAWIIPIGISRELREVEWEARGRDLKVPVIHPVKVIGCRAVK